MDRRTGKRGDGGFSLSDGTPGRKAPLSEEDGRRFAGSPAVPPPHPFLCSSPFLFLFRDFLDPPHPLSLSFLLSISPVIRRCPSLFFSMGRYDAITGENVKTVPHRRADLYNCRRPPSRRREPASGPSFVAVRFSSPRLFVRSGIGGRSQIILEFVRRQQPFISPALDPLSPPLSPFLLYESRMRPSMLIKTHPSVLSGTARCSVMNIG